MRNGTVSAAEIKNNQQPDSIKVAQLREAIKGHEKQLDLLNELLNAILEHPAIEPYVRN